MTWIALIVVAVVIYFLVRRSKEESRIRQGHYRNQMLEQAEIEKLLGRDQMAERARRQRFEKRTADPGQVGRAPQAEVENFSIAIFDPEDGSGSIGVILQDADDEAIHWRAWDEVTEGQLFSVKAVGGQKFHPTELQMDEFSPGQPVMLVRERENPADPNAVAVFDSAGRHKVGYVPADQTGRVHEAIAADAKAWVAWETMSDGGRVGLRLAVVTGPLKQQFESAMATVRDRV
jgi:hypothetical protein